MRESNIFKKDDINAAETMGWMPDAMAAAFGYEQSTQKYFDKAVGGTVKFDETAFNRGEIPPLVDIASFEEYLNDRASMELKLWEAGKCQLTWVAADHLGVNRSIANQSSYPSCSPYAFTECVEDILLRSYAKGQSTKFEEFNAWYTYVISGDLYMNGTRGGGRTIAAPARAGREKGMYPISLVGDYLTVAKKEGYRLDYSKGKPSEYQVGYCYIGELPVSRIADLTRLAAICGFAVSVGSQNNIVESRTKFAGFPVGVVSGRTMHATRYSDWMRLKDPSSGVVKEFLKHGNSHGAKYSGGPGNFPRDSQIVECGSGVRSHLSGGYYDAAIIICAESESDYTTDLMPPDIQFPTDMQKLVA